MCGIVGVFQENSEHDEVLYSRMKESLSVLESRGPDYQEIKRLKHSLLGHTRLSILDLNYRSNQPMSIDDNLHIVYNGEIYNYQEIRNRLINEFDCQFRTSSDTEVILQSYKFLGIKETLALLRGMFAFCIYDTINNEVYLGRDRMGEKPLFYITSETGLKFASNVGSLSKLLNDKKLNSNGIIELLGNQYISSNQSIYRGVKKLAPGNYLKFNFKEIEIKQYWSLSYVSKVEMTFDQAVDRVDELLNQSVKEQLITSDVPVGVFLSGGNDSALVTAIASKYKSDLQSITMSVSGDLKFDETEDAKQIAEFLGIDDRYVSCSGNQYLNELTGVLKSIEPFGDSSIIPSLMVSREAKKLNSVVLTGDGGDEVFGGYGKAVMAKINPEKVDSLGGIIKYFGGRRMNPNFMKYGGYSQSGFSLRYGGIKNYLISQDFMSPYMRKLLLRKELRDQISISQGDCHLRMFDDQEFCKASNHDKILYWGVKKRLVDDYLMKVDSATMCYSLESRSPFLDHRLIDFTSSVKEGVLMPNNIDKEILKTVLERYLPKEMIYKRKRGFSIPVADLFRGEWGEKLKSLLNEGRSEDMKLFNHTGVRRILDWHEKKEIPQISRLLFSILSFELWLEANYK